LNLGDISAAPSTAPSSVRAAFERLRAARDRQPGLEYDERQAALATLDALLREHGGEVATAIDRDFGGRAEQETQLLEIFPSRGAIRHARRHLKRWMRARRVPTGFWFLPGRSSVLPQPLGVVGIVVPWNYPLYLAIGPIVSALAAGNRVMVKMSEAAPLLGHLLERLVAARIAPEVLTIVNGGPDVGREFTSLPFDHLLFTGSTAVGREVMRAAADNLTPVTLELGGKSPVIVGRGFDVAQAAERIVYGKCLNAGQTCIAPDYVLVPEERLDGFVAAARAAVARLYPTLRDNRDYTAVINTRHRERLAGYLEEVRAAGARVEVLNPSGEDLAASPKMAPTLVIGAPEGARLMREEIFGPILPLVPYGTLGDAITYVNARPRPLALYVFEHDRAALDEVLARTVSGGVTVNDTILHVAQEELPFGGVGPSGMGEYHGRAGFDTFSKRKAIFRQSRVNGLALLRPPYGRRFRAMVRMLLR